MNSVQWLIDLAALALNCVVIWCYVSLHWMVIILNSHQQSHSCIAWGYQQLSLISFQISLILGMLLVLLPRKNLEKFEPLSFILQSNGVNFCSHTKTDTATILLYLSYIWLWLFFGRTKLSYVLPYPIFWNFSLWGYFSIFFLDFENHGSPQLSIYHIYKQCLHTY